MPPKSYQLIGFFTTRMNSISNSIIVMLAVVMLPGALFAQITGQPYVTQIPFHSELGDPQINFFLQDDEDMMLMGSSAGLISYDGSTWDIIPTSDVPICGVFDGQNNRLIIGSRLGLSQFNAVSGRGYQLDTVPAFPENIGQIDRIIPYGQDFLAIGEQKIVSIPSEPAANGFVYQDSTLRKSGAFVSDGIIYLLHLNGDISVVGKNGPESKNSTRMTKNAGVKFSVQSPDGVFIGLDDDSIWRYQAGKVSKLQGELAEFMSRNILSDAKVISNDILAISTLAGGMIMARTSNLEVLYRFNHATGFTDNEVIALGIDNSGGAWMAHQGGISRVEIDQPISVMSGYPGLDGDITCSLVHLGKLYVGTSYGLYELTKSTDRKEIEEILKMEQQGTGFGPDLNLVPNLRKRSGPDSRYNATRSMIPGSRPGSTGSVDVLPPGSQVPGKRTTPMLAPSQTKPPVSKTPQVIERTLFRKVLELDVKVRSLVRWEDHLLAVTNNGLYSIENGRAKNLTPEEYILSVHSIENGLLVSTTAGLATLSKQGKTWNLNQTHNLKDLAYSLFVDDDGIWVGSDNKVILLSNTGDQKEIRLDLSGNQRVTVTGIYGKAHFLTNDGVFHYSASNDTVIKATLPGITGASRFRFLVGNNNEVWIRDESGWQIMNNDAHSALLPYLELFDDIGGISSDENGNLYVVDKKAGLYQISNAENHPDSDRIRVYIKHAKAGTGHLFELGKMALDPDHSSVSVRLSAPFYLKTSSSEYQYRLDGLKDSDWGKWSTESHVEIPFLPAGDYTLEVRARCVLGDISDVQRLSFTIEPVFWLRWYMIFNYIVVGVILVLIIMNIRERSLRSDQKKLEEMVLDRTSALEQEKKKVEELLLNILPKETAQELQTKGKATAKQYNSASVLFTDFKDFTKLTTNVSAEELVSELDRYFIHFDEICLKYGLEKIKTIGDSYMCACGVPVKSSTHALAITLAGWEMCEYMKEVAESKIEQGLTPWEIRVGIHSGPLTAGVVGKNKFAYDIWGDTVNAASRMESNSEAGKINISLVTYGMIRQYFNCSPRGKLEVKGKGEMEMFFVNGLRPEFLQDGEPNGSILEMLQKGKQA